MEALAALFARWGAQLVAAGPAFAAALAVLAVGWLAGRLVGAGIRRAIRRAVGEEDLARGLGNIARFAVTLGALLVAAVVAFPSVRPADVLAFLGFGSVAVGFAFKDVFQNFMAGILILFRRPFRLGDQIVTGGIEGTVEDVNLRATIIETYDGERVIVPNSEVYGKPVWVRTAYGRRRSRFVVGIGYADDVRRAKAVIADVLAGAEGVLAEPAPWVRTQALAPSSVDLEVLYWTRAHQAEVLRAGDRVATGIKLALDAAGIDMPYPVRRVLLEPVAAPDDAAPSGPATRPAARGDQ